MKSKIIFFNLFILTAALFSSEKPSILIVYYVSKKIPFVNWKDGFVSAIGLLQNKYNISWASLDRIKNGQINCNDFDIIFVKSAWNLHCERYMRQMIPKHKKKALLISGVNLPSNNSDFYFYDILFYETEWYKQYIKEHPNCIRAFGINTDIMKPPPEPVNKIYDYIMVCDFKIASKKHLSFLSKPGKKLAVGSIDGGGDNEIITAFKNAGIVVMDSLSHEELAKLYHRSHKAYLPCTISGGGDRSLLEARSCGLTVEIEDDNPKLKELLDGPILDHYYYAKQLEKGIQVLLKK